MPSDIGLKDRELLNLIQSAFPLVETPFFRIGESLGLDESDVLERIQRLKDTNIVRQISAIFDTRKLGYKSSLVAMRFEANSLDDSAHVISEHPGVSHNYARDGHYNLWFTLAVPPEDSLEDTVDDMAKATNAEAYRLMPTIRFFKIGVNFDMVKGEGAGDQAVKPMRQGANGQQATPLTDSERHVVRELQEDISIEPAPFEGMAGRLGMSQTDLFAVANDMIDSGVMRRFSAVLHHRRAGFRSNAMVVWKVPK
jgi:DNA-binding Lrp family transcriptional regulator